MKRPVASLHFHRSAQAPWLRVPAQACALLWALWLGLVPAGAFNPDPFDRRTIVGASAPAVVMGSAAQARGVVVINEIHYHPIEAGASFVEVYNTSPALTFDLSGWELRGTGFTFPSGALLGPGALGVVVANRIEFARVFGLTPLPLGEFTGTLENGGETLRLASPATVAAPEVIVDEVRYDDDPPWATGADGFGSSLQLIDPAQDHNRPGNWGAAPTNGVVRATPGVLNSVRASLPPFPNVLLNEVLPENLGGFLDGFGDPDPWVELYNPGSSSVDLTGLYLGSSMATPLQWPFPVGTTIPAGGYLVVWLDAEPGETTTSELHANFRPTPGSGTILLTRPQGDSFGGIDGLNYVGVGPGRSFGSFPDGQALDRRIFHFPTLRGANNPRSITTSLVVNEWMAANTKTLADPADNDFDDWFELYNPGVTAVDLAGYYLTDTPTNKFKYVVPPGYLVPAGGFLLVWADEEGGQNSLGGDLHANFKLSATGEYLGIYAPDGTLVNEVTFGPQLADVSECRFPDGAGTTVRVTRTPTPRQPNLVPPQITTEPQDLVADADATVTFGVRVSGSGPFTYQWRKGTTPVAGGNQQDLVLGPLTTDQGGGYTVLVSNASGSATSREASLTVRPPALPTVRFQAASVQGRTGAEVLLPVTTRGFSSMASMQFSIQWDPAALGFVAVEGLGLEGLTAASFSTAAAAAGSVVVSWDDSSGAGATLATDATVFVLRFSILGAGGASPAVRITSSPLPIESALLIAGVPTIVPTFVADGRVEILSTVELSGAVRYYAGDRPITGAALEVFNDAGVKIDGAAVGVDGAFRLQTAPGGARVVRVVAPVEPAPAQGITTLDISLLRRHILGIAPFDNPHALLAADVNGSSSVTTLDISLMRRVILGVSPGFPGGNWRFVPSNATFANPAAPWAVETQRTIPILDGPRPGLDFVAVKLGDVNGSWTAAPAPPPLDPGAVPTAPAPRPDAPLVLEVGSVVAQAGDELEVPLRAWGFRGITTVQFTVRWPSSQASFVGAGRYGLSRMDDSNVGTARLSDGLLTVSWDDPNGAGVDVPDGQLLMSLRLKARPGVAAGRVRVDSSPTPVEITQRFSVVTPVLREGLLLTGQAATLSVSPAAAGGGLDLMVPRWPGSRTLVEMSDAAAGSTWVPVGTLAGDPGQVRVPVDARAAAARFFRFTTLP